MNEVMSAIIFIGVPMCLAYFVFRMIDKSGSKTRKVVDKFPVILKHKFVIQIGGMVGFVLIFGIICTLVGIPKSVFYVISGIIVGVVNGMSATIMYNDMMPKKK